MLPLVFFAVLLCSARQCVLVSAEINLESQNIVSDETDLSSVYFKENLASYLLERIQKNEKETETMRDQLVSQKLEIEMLHEKIDSMQTTPRHDEPNTPPETKQMYHGKSALGGEITRSIRESGRGTPVAFYAQMSKHLMHAGINQTLIFDNVLLNEGNGYHPYTGIFTAPYNGIYIFSATILSYQGVSGGYYIYLDDNSDGNLYVDGSKANSYDTTSLTIALYVRQNQSVMVRNEVADTHTYGDDCTTFTGFLLHNFEEGSPIVGK